MLVVLRKAAKANLALVVLLKHNTTLMQWKDNLHKEVVTTQIAKCQVMFPFLAFQIKFLGARLTLEQGQF